LKEAALIELLGSLADRASKEVRVIDNAIGGAAHRILDVEPQRFHVTEVCSHIDRAIVDRVSVNGDRFRYRVLLATFLYQLAHALTLSFRQEMLGLVELVQRRQRIARKVV